MKVKANSKFKDYRYISLCIPKTVIREEKREDGSVIKFVECDTDDKGKIKFESQITKEQFRNLQAGKEVDVPDVIVSTFPNIFEITKRDDKKEVK